jgi:hypothetical protein
VERGTDLVRLSWCDLERVSLEAGKLLVTSEEMTLSIPVAAHPQAVAHLLKEGIQRLPDVIDVKRRAMKELPKPDPEAGEELRVEGIQVAGRHCKESDKLISVERDARTCPTCCEVYHRLHVPRICATCEQPLGSRAIAL